jgi:hypothetical protein
MAKSSWLSKNCKKKGQKSFAKCVDKAFEVLQIVSSAVLIAINA